jgi:hypothetical protein
MSHVARRTVRHTTSRKDTMKVIARGCFAGVVTLALSGTALAQDSESSRLAKQLSAALEAAKVDSIAARDPTGAGTYIAALYVAGTLLVISAQYAAPTLLDQKLVKKEYREIYLDLNGAAMPGTKVFVEDFGADGLHVRPDENKPPDSYETGGKQTTFNGDWKAQKLSEQEYQQTFAAAGSQYRRLLTALLAELTKK